MEIISLTAVLILLWLLRPSQLHPAILYGLIGLLSLGLGLRVWPSTPLPNNNLTWDFAQMGYLHHNTKGIPIKTVTIYNNTTTVMRQ